MDMSKKYRVEVILNVTDAATGEPFSETTQTWASMSLASVVGIERALHTTQGDLIAWSEREIAGA